MSSEIEHIDIQDHDSEYDGFGPRLDSAVAVDGENNIEFQADLFDEEFSAILHDNSFDEPNHTSMNSSWQLVDTITSGVGASRHSFGANMSTSSVNTDWMNYSSEHIRRLDSMVYDPTTNPFFAHPVFSDTTDWINQYFPAAHARHVHSRMFPTSVPVVTANQILPSDSIQHKRVHSSGTWKNIAVRIGNLNWSEVKDADRSLAMNKWRSILQISPQSSTFGRTVLDDVLLFKSDDHLVQSLTDALAMKATKTLHKRANSAIKFMSWCSNKQLSPFPVVESTVYAFLRDCSWQSPGFGNTFRECLNFLGGVLGFDGALHSSSSPRVAGFCANRKITSKKRPQAKVLSVKQVSSLETLVRDAPEIQDRVMAGQCLFNIYGRCRWSDIQCIEKIIEDIQEDGSGFIEGHTFYTKTSNTIEKRRTFLPLTAVTDGLVNNMWYRDWMKARTEANLPPPTVDVAFMPAVDTQGKFCTVPLSPSLASQWLRDLLILSGHNKREVEGVSSHSLKSTCLSWTAKAGVAREHRQILGYHMVAGSQSVLHYSRDEQAEPLRQLAAVLLNVRLGNFDPDSTRSGYWKLKPAEDPKPKSKAAGNNHLAVIPATVQPIQQDHALSSDSSSSSERTPSEGLSDEEQAFRHKRDSDEQPSKRRASGNANHGGLAVHSRWRTLHAIHNDDNNKLACGRPVTSLYRLIVERPSFEHFKCQVCFGQS